MRQLIKHFVSFIVVFVIFLLFAFQLKENWSSFQQVQWTQNPLLLFSHFFLTIAFFFLMACGWIFLLKFSGARLGFHSCAATWLVANIGKYIPGKVFMLLGRVEFCSKLGVRRSIAFTAMLYEHILQLIITFPFVAWIMIQGFRLNSKWGFGIIITLMIFCIIILIFPRILFIFINVLLKKVNREPLEFFPEPQQMFFVAGIYFIAWIGYGFSGVMLGKGLNLIGSTPSFIVLVTFIASWMIGFVSVLTPGGIGVREGVIVLLLNPYIGMPQAIVLALIARLSWTGVELTGFGIGYWMLKKKLGDQ